MSSPVKVVVLELDGDCRIEPVRVKLEFGPQGQLPTMQQIGELPPCPELIETMERWRDRYRHLGHINRALKPQEILYEGRIRPVTVEECRTAAEELAKQFQQWLAVDSFRLIDEQLREECDRNDSIQVSIRTPHRILQRLPWHLWRFIERYPQAEVGLSAPVAELPPQTAQPRHSRNIRILAILGHRDGIDIETDRRLLNHIPGAEVCFLAAPGRANLSQSLWDEPWDILFFAGHSETVDTQGRIYLSPEESLTLDELRNSLRRAIRNGLKLAIFNSCDGLGLAYELEQLNIPQMIVMREPIPDSVAQAFLKGFLQAFLQGMSLHEAVREARERLEGLERDYPCASWLPVIYENPIAPTLSWQALKGHERFSLDLSNWRQTVQAVNYRQLVPSILISLIVTLIVIGLRMTGFLQAWELQAYDHMMRSLQKPNDISSRIVTVTIDDRDLEYQTEQGIRSESSISDAALLRLLTQIEPYQPAVIGFDIIHNYPFSSELESYFQTHDNLIAICRADIPQSDLPGVLPPYNIAEDNIGFINFPLDSDGVLRRQFFGMEADSFCPTTQSLSFKVATQFLQKSQAEQLQMEHTEDSFFLQKAVFKKLPATAGGYQLPPKESTGVQILTDYRVGNIRKIPLREVLTPSQNQLKGLFDGKIVLIGVDSKNKDRHVTPLVSDFTRQTPGVIVHAIMAETILRAALGEGKAISWWSELAEAVWIGLWALVCTFLAILIRSYWFYLGAGILSLMQYPIGLYGMSNNVWIPVVPVMVGLVLCTLLNRTLLNSKRTRTLV
jgi:CHASE2 domain-containing sensor protein